MFSLNKLLAPFILILHKSFGNLNSALWQIYNAKMTILGSYPKNYDEQIQFVFLMICGKNR